MAEMMCYMNLFQDVYCDK